MQVKDILPMLALLKSQRVKLYHAPGGNCWAATTAKKSCLKCAPKM